MILFFQSLVPLDSVLPVLFQHLPLRQDLDEYEVIFTLLGALQVQGHPIVISELPKIVNCSLHLVTSDEEFNSEKVIPTMISVMQRFSNEKPEELKMILANCAPDQTKLLIEKL